MSSHVPDSSGRLELFKHFISVQYFIVIINQIFILKRIAMRFKINLTIILVLINEFEKNRLFRKINVNKRFIYFKTYK